MDDKMQDIKRQFFAMRNGVLADQLRTSGHPAKVIFGLNVPQIAEIARALGRDHEFAGTLWADAEVRESRLLATYLFDPTSVSQTDADALILSVRSPEEADMLCFRLLKHLSFAPETMQKYRDADEPLLRYLSRSLERHLQ